MTLRRFFPLLCIQAIAAGCLAERAHERDPRLANELTRQERWTQDSIAGRATPEDLTKLRGGDQETIALGRKQLRKLIASVDRGTWIREATVESLRDDGDDAGLSADFEKAGHLRTEALQAADELAQALAEVHGGLALSDLRSGLASLRKARESEARLSRELGAAATAKPGSPAVNGQPTAGNAQTPASAQAQGGKAPAMSPLAKLSTASLPVPKPFISATARYLYANPEEKLTGFGSDDAGEIRTQLAELESHPPAETRPAPSPAPGVREAATPPDPSAADREAASDAAAADRRASGQTPAPSLTVAGDAQKLISKRGPPRSFTARSDGLFALRYQEKRPCGIDACDTLVDYLFDAAGKLVRDEPTKP